MKGSAKRIGLLVLGLGLAACSTTPELPVEAARTYAATPTQLSGALRALAPSIQPGPSWSPYAVSASTEYTLSLTTERLDVPNTHATTTFGFTEVGTNTRVRVSTSGMRGDHANSMNYSLLTRLEEQFRACSGDCAR